MAQMKDKMPENYAGEQLVWKKLQELPEDIICYNHREINGREFDFCLLLPEIGFLIIEVKGWHLHDVVQVTSPDEIRLRNDQIVGSPKKQARGYRFALLNQLQENSHINPLVMDMVCYPFLSEREYKQIGLSVVSEPETTIFSDDLSSIPLLSRKIIRLYQQMKGLAGDLCKGMVYDVCRQYFEPGYTVKPPMPTAIPYSCLSVYSKPLTIADVEQIMKGYFSGVKQIIFVFSPEDLEVLANNLTKLFQKNNICFSHGDLQFGNQGTSITVQGNKLITFQFEAIYVGAGFFQKSFIVYNGELSTEQFQQLSHLPKEQLFNLEQYQIEHAPINRNIQVRAGAGTGKTYSMVARIAFLCSSASNSGIHTPSDEIAMLTFTTDAATNMKNRLKRLFMNYFVLTKDTKYLELVSDIEKMRISTIHSFAGELFKSTSLTLGVGTNYTVVQGEYEKRLLFEQILNDYLAKKNLEEPLFFENLPKNIFDFQKDLYDISKQLYNKGCDITELPFEAFGTPPKELPILQGFIEHAVIPTEKEYRKKLSENNSLHLSQYMIYLKKCIMAEEFNQNLFRFRYIFIDEFQDTDDAQIEAFLLMQKKLSFHFFIVGDLKQSIYRFRGATMDAFQRIGIMDDEWLKYHLAINYRTDLRLLEEFDEVFNSMGKKRLLPYIPEEDALIGVSYNKNMPEEELFQCCTYTANERNSGEFYDKLFQKIKEQKAELEKRLQKTSLSVPERTIAILTRTNSQIKQIIQNARGQDIQIESDSSGDLYQLQSTLDLCKLTAALCNPYHPTYLFDLIHSNNVGVEFDPKLLAGLEESKKTSLLIQCLDQYYAATLEKSWEELIYDAQHKPILMVLRLLYEGTEPWKRAFKIPNMQAFYRANYDLLFEELSKMNKKTYLTLDSVNESLHIAITTELERESRTLEIESDGVRVLCTTVHKAKGLEFGTVILPFTDRIGTSLPQNGLIVTYIDGKVGYCISTKQGLYCNSYFDEETESQEAAMEEARILYVAMTRAIQKFIWFKKEEHKPGSWGNILEESYHGD